MKKQIVLTIIIGYATFMSTSVNAGDLELLKRYDSPQYINFGQTNNWIDDHIMQESINTAKQTAVLGTCLSTDYLCSKSPTVENIALTTVGTLTASGVSFFIKYCYTWHTARPYRDALRLLISQNTELLDNSIDATGLMYHNKYAHLHISSLGEIPTTNQLLQRKKQLERLFPQETHNASEKEKKDLVFIYDSAKECHDLMQRPFSARVAVEECHNKLLEAVRAYGYINNILEYSKSNAFFTHIINETKIKDKIEYNLALYREVSNLRPYIEEWIENPNN